jgi:hypothetical protein
MRIRSLAAATLLTLQALVAARPFVALSAIAGPSVAPAAADMAGMHHAMAPAADPPCHHAAAAPADADAVPSTSDESSPAGHHAPTPAHDHDSTACHAGTPCCAPTLPVTPTELPTVRAHVAQSVPRTPDTRATHANTHRRLPPATAPPALS